MAGKREWAVDREIADTDLYDRSLYMYSALADDDCSRRAGAACYDVNQGATAEGKCTALSDTACRQVH